MSKMQDDKINKINDIVSIVKLSMLLFSAIIFFKRFFLLQ